MSIMCQVVCCQKAFGTVATDLVAKNIIDINHLDYLRTALLAKIVNYVYWPDDVSDQHFNICVLGSDLDSIKAVWPYLHMLDKRNNDHRLFRVFSMVDIHDNQALTQQNLTKKCQILYLVKLSPAELERVVYFARDHQMVTISSSLEYLRQGALIGLIQRRGRLKIIINNQALEQSGIRIKSSLLRIAKSI